MRFWDKKSPFQEPMTKSRWQSAISARAQNTLLARCDLWCCAATSVVKCCACHYLHGNVHYRLLEHFYSQIILQQAISEIGIWGYSHWYENNYEKKLIITHFEINIWLLNVILLDTKIIKFMTCIHAIKAKRAM